MLIYLNIGDVMRLSFKQKAILYISVVFFILIALYSNIFLKERKDLDVDAMTQNVDIYVDVKKH